MENDLGWVEADWSSWDCPDNERNLVINWRHVESIQKVEVEDEDGEHCPYIVANMVSGKEVTIYAARTGKNSEIQHVFNLLVRKLNGKFIVFQTSLNETLEMGQVCDDDFFEEDRQSFLPAIKEWVDQLEIMVTEKTD